MLKVVVESMDGKDRFEQEIDAEGERAIFEEKEIDGLTFHDWARPLNFDVNIDSDPIEELKGKHFVYDFMNSFFETDEFPDWVYEVKDGYRVIVLYKLED
jgi:hypothetical protein